MTSINKILVPGEGLKWGTISLFRAPFGRFGVLGFSSATPIVVAYPSIS
jgi:hypothetical protein